MRIISTQNGAIDTVASLDAGQYYDFEGPSDQGLYLLANKPVQLVQLCKSWGADESRYSDPFMSVVPAVSQFVNTYAFTTPTSLTQSDPFSNYVSLIIRTTQVNGLKLDGSDIGSDSFVIEWTTVGETVFSYAAITLATGRHVLKHEATSVTFGAQLYGIKLQESYGHPLGQKLEPIENICVVSDMFAKDYFDNDCDGRFDEEILNGRDDDGDGIVDEDVYDQFTARPYDPQDDYNVMKADGEIFNAPAATTTPRTTTLLSTTLDATSAASTTDTETATSYPPTTDVTTQEATISSTTVAGSTSSTERFPAAPPSATPWASSVFMSLVMSTLMSATVGMPTTTDFSTTVAMETTSPTIAETTTQSQVLNTTMELNMSTNSIFNATTRHVNATDTGNVTTTLPVTSPLQPEATTQSETTSSEPKPTSKRGIADKNYNIFEENPSMVIVPVVVVVGIPTLYCFFHCFKAACASRLQKYKKNRVDPNTNRLEKQLEESEKQPAFVPASKDQSMEVDLRPNSNDDLPVLFKPIPVKSNKKRKKPIVG